MAKKVKIKFKTLLKEQSFAGRGAAADIARLLGSRELSAELAAWVAEEGSAGISDTLLKRLSVKASNLAQNPAVRGNFKLSQGLSKLAGGALSVAGLYYLITDLAEIQNDPSIQGARWNDLVAELGDVVGISLAKSGPGLPPSYWGVEKCEDLSGYGTRMTCEKSQRKKGITKDPADLQRARTLARRAEAGKTGAGTFSSFIDDITPSSEFIGRLGIAKNFDRPARRRAVNEGMKCKKGWKKAGTQKIFGKTYNRCVKAEAQDEEKCALTEQGKDCPVHGKNACPVEESNPRIPRKKGQKAKSKKHSDLYTDEDPKGTIHGLGFKDEATARASVAKIRKSSRSHAHKTQAAIAMEQRAKAAGKSGPAAIFRRFIEQQKKKTKAKAKKNESLNLDYIKLLVEEQLCNKKGK
jgi:hypothetical protein